MTSPENMDPSLSQPDYDPNELTPPLDEDAGSVHNAHLEVGDEDDPEAWF